MNVASAELSKALYELSGWDDLYDLGYLLRMLPAKTLLKKGVQQYDCKLPGYKDNGKYTYAISAFADTPEDATAKLAIELFKQGVLK